MEKKLSYQMNVFAPTEEIKGRKCLPANTESFSGIIDATVEGDVVPATPVIIAGASEKLPHFIPAKAGDKIRGFVEWNVIRTSYKAGDMVQVSPAGNVMYMEASDEIQAGVEVAIKDYDAVTIATAGDGDTVIGYTLEAATAAGELVRVKIKI